MNKKYFLLIPIVIIIVLLLVFCNKAERAPAVEETVPTTVVTEAVTEVPTEETTGTVEKETTEKTIETEPKKIEEQNTASIPEKSVGVEEIGNESNSTTPTAGSNSGNTNTQQPANPQKPTEPQSCGCEYEQYLAMSAADQEAYMKSFPSMVEFINWSKSAAAAHDGHNTGITVEGGDLNIGDFIN